MVFQKGIHPKTEIKIGQHLSRKTEFKKGNKKSLKAHRFGIGHKINLGKKLTEEHKRKISESHKGEKAYQWKGGINLENERLRHSLEWKIWRNEVYKRDNWTCRLCGKKCERKNIAAHHIKLFSEFPELRFSIDNGITLCRSCHLKVHKKQILEGEIVD